MNNLPERIHQKLNTGRLAEILPSLFCEVLRWSGPRGIPPRELSIGKPMEKTLRVHPVAQLSGLPVLRLDWTEDRLPGVTARRAVLKALKPTHAEHLLCYITRDQQQAAFTWARTRADGKTEIRTLPYEVGSPARTTIERLGELAFNLDDLATGEPPITALTDKLNRAFDVEAVTKQFFEDYMKVFRDLQRRLAETSHDKVWAHDYALQLLNRLMFLYFIQRKRWLGGDPRFVQNFWQAYKTPGQPKDTFLDRWLSVLFFEAFNNKFHGGHRHFPDSIRTALAQAPYLNGGLFTRNKQDDDHDATLSDDFFATLFDRFDGSSPGFLERYNFTIAESTPLDIEVAVDPEMIGKVYESLVNITFEGLTEEDLRGSAGIFYTPRVEIDLMCRLSLVDALANHLGQQHKPLLYDLVLAYDPADKETADEVLAAQNLWPDLNRLLRETTVCDPACGSGSFLVGMLLVLDDLQSRANAQLGHEETPYERRRIIGEQLYGVDVMDWAVHIAELRLWLQLVVETELQPAELKFRPLLPNLSFKVRQGDSLVQEIGGINFGLHRAHLDLPTELKGRLTRFKGEKLRFYQGDPDCRFRSEALLKQEELRLFRDLIHAKHKRVSDELAYIRRRLQATTKNLMGETVAVVDDKSIQLLREQQAAYEIEHEHIQRASEALRAVRDDRPGTVPFVWDIAFVEIFEGDKAGFDIVLGNPPYVRQEKIAPPLLREQDFKPDDWRNLKADYKSKLQQSVCEIYPRFLKNRKPDGKSDLYVYFYLHGLSLLNEKGAFCFITSNSWLDVGYGRDLQEFLLKHGHVKLILDNERRRSFAQADVNTIIALLGPPDDERADGLNKTARFVMFKVLFEEVLSASLFKSIEGATERQAEVQYRVIAKSQRELYEEGLASEEPEDDEEAEERPKRKRKAAGPLVKVAKHYEANKWGGKYLRAPEIFFTILEKGKGKLVRLGDVADIATVSWSRQGQNESLMISKHSTSRTAQMVDVLKSPRNITKIKLTRADTSHLLRIERWVQEQIVYAPILWVDLHGDKHIVHRCLEPIAFTHNFHGIRPLNKDTTDILCAVLNGSLSWLLIEVLGRRGLGGGAVRVLVEDLRFQFPVLAPSSFTSSQSAQILHVFEQLSKREVKDIFSELHQPDRRALDEVVFDVLGLTAGEREAVYEAVVELVRRRLEKARSV